MTTNEANIILARFLGWEEKSFMHNRKRLIAFKGPDDTNFSSDLQFDKDWNLFQLAFQKAKPEEPNFWTASIMAAFHDNNLKEAVDCLVKLINETNQTA